MTICYSEIHRTFQDCEGNILHDPWRLMYPWVRDILEAHRKDLFVASRQYAGDIIEILYLKDDGFPTYPPDDHSAIYHTMPFVGT